MKTVRIISRLDIKGSNVVKGVHLEGLRVVGEPKKLAYKYYEDGADEIIYVDVVASLYQRNLDFEQLKKVSENIFIPFTVGGGIRSITDINNALRAGADKVAINTFAIFNPVFLKKAATEFGSQCIVLSIEAKKIAENKWEAYTEGGRETTGVDVIEWVKKGIDLGVGEIMLTSIDTEGTKKGFDIELAQAVTSFSSVPVIIHGGAGNQKDFAEVIQKGYTDAVSASSVYHYNDFTVADVKKNLAGKGVLVRKK